MNLIAIHQPNFFSWLGYFDKIIRSDLFVFLDHVQFPKKGGVWTNRVKLMVAGEARWVTAPVDRKYHGVRSICEMEFQRGVPWREKMLKSLEANYAKSGHFDDVMEFITPLVMNQENNVGNYNIHAVKTIAGNLGQPTDKFRVSSEMNIQKHSTEMLIEMVSTLGGRAYMCGGGADGYQEDAAFHSAGIDLIYQDFQHPVYLQGEGEAFVSGLSILDALFHLGVDGTRELLDKSGRS